MTKDFKKYLLIAGGVFIILMIFGILQKQEKEPGNTNVSDEVTTEAATQVSDQPLIDYSDKIESYVLRSGSGNEIGKMGYLEIAHDEFLNINGDEIYKFMTENYPILADKYNYIVVRSDKDEGMLINNSEIVTVGIVGHDGRPKVEDDEQFYNTVKDVGNVSRNWVHKGDTFVYVEEKKSN